MVWLGRGCVCSGLGVLLRHMWVSHLCGWEAEVNWTCFSPDTWYRDRSVGVVRE